MTLRGQIKASDEQLAFMAKFMRDHPDLAAGYNCGGHAEKLRINRLWKELTQRLNALGGPSKKPQQWRKAWTYLQSFENKKNIAQSKLRGRAPYVKKVVGVLTPCTIVGQEDNASEPTSVNLQIPTISSEDQTPPDDGTTPNYVVLSARNYNKPVEALPLHPDTLPEDGPTEDLEEQEEAENYTEANTIDCLNENVDSVPEPIAIAPAPYSPDTLENCITENYIVSSILDPNSEGMPLIPDNESNSLIDDNMISTVQTDPEEMLLFPEDSSDYVTDSFIVSVPTVNNEDVPLISDISSSCLPDNYVLSNPNMDTMMLNPNVGNSCMSPNFIVSPTQQIPETQSLIADTYSVGPSFIVSSTPENVANYYVSTTQDNNPVVPLISDNNCMAPSYIMSAPPSNPEAVQLIPDNINNCMTQNFIMSPGQPHPLSMMVTSGVELYPISMVMSPNLELGPSFYIVNQ